MNGTTVIIAPTVAGKVLAVGAGLACMSLAVREAIRMVQRPAKSQPPRGDEPDTW